MAVRVKTSAGEKSALEEIVFEALKRQIEIVSIESAAVRKTAKSKGESLERQLVLLKAQYDACDREKFTIYENYREGKLTPEEYLSGKDALAQKQAALKEQLESCETQLEVFHQQSLDAEDQHEAEKILGRVVIPKEIRRTMRIREGDPLEIYTSREGEVIFKKYSLLGGVEDFAAELCETMSRSTGSVCAVTDRDTVIAVAGGSKRELMGKRITPELEQIMESRKIYQYTGEGQPLQVTEGIDSLLTTVAAPILAEGDLLGLVLFISSDPAAVTGDTEYKLAQTIAAFLGRHMES